MGQQVSLAGRRVLIVADFNRTSFGSAYYKSWFSLHNGFVRAGAHVLTVSDRDVAREAGLLAHKRFGQRRMNQIIVETAKGYQPHLAVFGHTDMTGGDTLETLRRAAPGTRLAQIHLDPVFRDQSMARFSERAQSMDASFITTGAPDTLARLAPRTGTVAFCPNPVDWSLAHVDVSAQERETLKYDGIFLGNGDHRREPQVRELQENLVPSFRFHASGKIFDTPRLTGPAFLETLAQGAMSPNLPLDDRRPVDFLYSSDRIAQLLAFGITAFCRADAKLEQIYEDGIVNYTTIPDLAAKMTELAEDDARRRAIGAKGRRIGRERTSAERVARYIYEMTLEGAPSEDYGWPSELY